MKTQLKQLLLLHQQINMDKPLMLAQAIQTDQGKATNQTWAKEVVRGIMERTQPEAQRMHQTIGSRGQITLETKIIMKENGKNLKMGALIKLLRISK